MADREVWDGERYVDLDDFEQQLARSVVRPRQPTEADIEAVSARIGEWLIESRSGMEFPANWVSPERFEAIAGAAGFAAWPRPIKVTYRRVDDAR